MEADHQRIMEGVNRGLEAKNIEIKLEMAKLNNGGVELTDEQRQKVIQSQMALRAASRGASRPMSTMAARGTPNNMMRGTAGIPPEVMQHAEL